MLLSNVADDQGVCDPIRNSTGRAGKIADLE
jgi:hypothetical protein